VGVSNKDGTAPPTLLPASLVGTDALHDLAVLEVVGASEGLLRPVLVGSSANLKVTRMWTVRYS